MLVNLTPHLPTTRSYLQVAKENNFTYVPQHDSSLILQEGVYVNSIPFNFSHQEFEEFKDDANIPYKNSYEVFAPHYEKAQYGVADTVEQILNYFKEEVEDPERKFFIAVTFVEQERENKGKGGGWRWHKWGDYIGDLDHQHEHLDDEDFGEDFKGVYTFHLFEVTNNEKGILRFRN